MKSPAWGLPDLIPDDAPAYYGCRAILRNGVLDFVPNRTYAYFEDDKVEKVFLKWLNGAGLKWLRKVAKDAYGNVDELYEYCAPRFHMCANTQASYGYLYVTAWMDKGEV